MKTAFSLRPGTLEDAVPIAALATQVFLDTYATEGIRRDLADEAFLEYSVGAFNTRLKEPDRRFVLAEMDTGLVGFAGIVTAVAPAPTGNVSGAQLVRLYVQPAFQGAGVGKALIGAAETVATERSASPLWLIAWDGNERAIAFYKRQGYTDIGSDTYTFQGKVYGTRVLAKLPP